MHETVTGPSESPERAAVSATALTSWGLLPLAFTTTAVAGAVAQGFAFANGTSTRNVVGFALWSLPLGLIVAHVARRWNVERVAARYRWLAVAFVGLVVGACTTLCVAFLSAGWLLTWGVPALTCWMIAGSAGLLIGAMRTRAVDGRGVAAGLVIALIPVVLMTWASNRPTKALLVTFAKTSSMDPAEFVLDSVLRRPNDPTRHMIFSGDYMRLSSADGNVVGLFELRSPTDRALIVNALRGVPLVLSIRDTIIAR